MLTVSSLAITHNKVIVITDQLQDMEVQVAIQQKDREDADEAFQIEGKAADVRLLCMHAQCLRRRA